LDIGKLLLALWAFFQEPAYFTPIEGNMGQAIGFNKGRLSKNDEQCIAAQYNTK
jgi:hypothetical protein